MRAEYVQRVKDDVNAGRGIYGAAGLRLRARAVPPDGGGAK